MLRRNADVVRLFSVSAANLQVRKAQTPVIRFVVDLLYSKSTANRVSGVWA